MFIPPDDTQTPEPLYSCANDACSEEHSYPADDLYWVALWKGWYCSDCIDDIEEALTIGDRLDKWMEKQQCMQ